MKQGLCIIILGVALLLAGCGGGKPVRQITNLGDTPYQADSILVTYATNPERALMLLDSALLLGNISEYRGQFIRAKIYCKSLEKLRLDSAIIICETLLTHDSVRNEPTEQENVLDLLIATARAKHDNVAYLRWATQKAELCQQQGLENERWRTEAGQFRIVSLAVAVIALLAIAFAVYFFYQKRIVNEKNSGLVRLIDETIEYKERFVQLQNAIRRPSPEKPSAAPAELKTLSDEELFQHLYDDIRENKLYLDPMFDRQAVCYRYNLSIAQVGSAFAQGSDYSSVADFIRDCRLEHACVLLKTTDMKVTDVAAASGFCRPTTFNHDFKARFNLSPTEYRRQ